MAYVDTIIKFMRAQQGSSILIETDHDCVITKADGSKGSVSQRLNGAQIESLLREILPADQQEAFAGGGQLSFPYTSDGEAVQINVGRSNGALRVSIGVEAPAPAAAPPPQPAVAHEGPLKEIGHLDEMFTMMKSVEASDLHVSSNEHPMIRVHGSMRKLTEYEVNDPVKLKKLLWQIAPKRAQEQWEAERDTDFAYDLEGVARFRCNFFEDRHGIGGVFRLIPSDVLTCADLNLTKAMVDLCFLSKGLVLVTGPTGSGKSTTLAALVDHVNKHRTDHIITVEDPIEFVHENINCLVNQREVHVNTESFARALRAGLREDPDIVLVGEMRDLETVAIAIETAETGHLVFGTLHTTTAPSTVDRVIDQFPADQQEQIRTMLSEALKAVIAQTLLRTKEGRRVAAFEVLLIDPAAANLIREGKTYQLNSIMQIGKGRGCVTMAETIFEHVKAGRVDPAEGYLKVVDKVGLVQMYEKEGIKFDAGSLSELE